MSITADHSPGVVVIIDKKARSLDEVQARIAKLRQDQSAIDTEYNAASLRHANLHNELDLLTDALTASGYPVETPSPQ